MKKNNYIIFKIIVLLALSFTNCKRDNFDPYFGSQACPGDNFEITSEFSLNKADGELVNFQTQDSLHFKAMFSSSARWKIVITGETSHATATLEGFSNYIDTAWYGRSGGNLFFTNEKIVIDFYIICKPELTKRHNVSIMKTNFIFDPKLKLLTNFNTTNSVFPSGWIFYLDSDPVYGSGSADTVWCTSPQTCSTYNPSQEGGGYLSFIGNSPIPQGESKNVYGTYEIYPPNLSWLNSDPNQAWFNFLVNTEGTPCKAIVSFKHWNGKDGFGRKVLTINTTKWEMFSINLGSLEKDTSNVSSFNAKDIGIIIITVIQSGGIAPTTFNMDIPNFTKGNPYYGNIEE